MRAPGTLVGWKYHCPPNQLNHRLIHRHNPTEEYSIKQRRDKRAYHTCPFSSWLAMARFQGQKPKPGPNKWIRSDTHTHHTCPLSNVTHMETLRAADVGCANWALEDAAPLREGRDLPAPFPCSHPCSCIRGLI